MKTSKALLRLTPLALGLAVCLSVLAETPEQVQQRLEQYRQLDAEAARKEAEAERRREQTRQWQEQRRREEYARRWKCYGDEEIDVLLWRQQKDGTWVTVSKPASGFIDCPGSYKFPAVVRFGDSLVKLAQRYNLSIAELLRLNPGLQAARLVVGTKIHLAQPSVRPNPQQVELAPSPRRFDQSLDELVRQGVVSPEERSLIRSGAAGGLSPLDVGAFRKACGSGALSSAECRAGLAIRWDHQAGGTSQTLDGPSADSLLGVNCTSLMINRKPAYQGWGIWLRPQKDSADEQLVIDRCTAAKP